MPPGAGPLYLLYLALVELPLTFLRDFWRARQRWRAMPLLQRNQIRAAFGGFLVALCIGATAGGPPAVDQPPDVWVLVGVGAFGLLYLVGGIHGARRPARFDFFSAMWWGLGAAGCVAGLLALKGII